MKREFTIKLGDVEYPVVAEGDAITVDGRSFNVEITGDGATLVDGIPYDVSVEGTTATVGGDALEFEASGLALAAPPRPKKAAPGGGIEAAAGAIVAIMPGKIIRVPVKPGQKVAEGDPVCILEAMKMENELNAPHAGTVRAVHVHPGDDVEKGQVLIEIE